jgi:hypothetical protein
MKLLDAVMTRQIGAEIVWGCEALMSFVDLSVTTGGWLVVYGFSLTEQHLH